MSVLFFKKPAYVVPQRGPLSACQISGQPPTEACANAAIPAELSFENVICNKCAPPCSLQDFLDYLMYVTHDAENLQFYLWMVDYHQRFRKAPQAQKDLSPRWQGRLPANSTQREQHFDSPDPDMHSEDISAAASVWEGELSNDYTTTVNTLKFSLSPVKDKVPPSGKREEVQASNANQPFRTEINRIVNHYLAVGAPRELHLSHGDRATVLRALQYTTHPSALDLVKKMLDSKLRNQSHPNFVRWSICNGNKQWTIGLRAFAITNITIGFIIAIALTLSHYSRYWRIFAALEWWFGITNIIAASQGLCVLLHRMHSRQHHAWETENIPSEDEERKLQGNIDVDYISYGSTKSKWPVKMEVFGPANNYSGEEWVSTYPRKPWHKKLFEKRVEVEDDGLRSMQNTMIRQAEAWALLITIPLTVGFCAIPPANLY